MRRGSQAALTTFSSTDIAIHRVLRAYGKALDWWRELSEDDQFEYLAADRWRQDRLKQLRDGFETRIAANKPIEATPYFAVLMAEL